MILYPNAKINLGLSVVSKRADGYHNLETIFVPVPGLHDRLEVEPLADNSLPYLLEQTGIAVDCPPENNLIIRVYMKMREMFPQQVGAVRIRFCKCIPFGAGLGGGSADAAQMAVAVNQLFALGLSNEQLEDIVAPLGADCAFFIQNRIRFAEGIGNEFSDVPTCVAEQLRGKWIALIKPTCAVSTAAAYKGIHAHPAIVPLKEGICSPIEQWQQVVVNDFEESVFPQFPEIAALKEMLIEQGAIYAAMSGSGATVYALFATESDAANAVAQTSGIFTHIEQLA